MPRLATQKFYLPSFLAADPYLQVNQYHCKDGNFTADQAGTCCCALQGVALRKALLMLHPTRMPDVLRIAVNQLDDAAATAAVAHLRELSQQVLTEMHQEVQQQAQWLRESDVFFAQCIETPSLQSFLDRHQQQQQQITPELLQELLLLAAARHHYALMCLQLLKLEPAVSQLPSSAIAELLRTVMRSKFKECVVREAIVEQLCELPAAAGITVAEVCSMLQRAVARRQLNIIQILCDFFEDQQADISSSQALNVVMPAASSSWQEGLEWLEAQGVMSFLQPQHTEQLLQQALLTATLAGAGMQPAWCDSPVQQQQSSGADSPLPIELAVLKTLLGSRAANDLQPEHLRRLLLAAASLGNAGALALLLSKQAAVTAADTGFSTSRQLLELAVQYRGRAMMQLVMQQLDPFDRVTQLLVKDTLSGLLRSGDVSLLVQLTEQLAAVEINKEWLSMKPAHLLMVAGQLGRCSSIRALCKLYDKVFDMQWQLLPRELDQLLHVAVRKDSSSTVQCLLLQQQQQQQQQGGFGVPAGVAQRVVQRVQQEQQAFAAAAASERGMCLPPQQLEPQVQLNAQALQQAMQAGCLPDAAAHAMLLPSPCETAGKRLRRAHWDTAYSSRLLQDALQLPAGRQQQAWMKLLCSSRLATKLEGRSWHVAEILLAAVHAAYASASCAVLRLLCQTFQQLESGHAYPAIAAAVQLDYVPAARILLLTWPASQLLEPDHVAALLRWTISNSGSSSGSGAYSVPTVGDGRVQYRPMCTPLPPSCSAACAERLQLLFGLPGAQQLGPCDVVGLLVFAMQQGNVEAVQQLCMLAAAAELDRRSVLGLLRWARVLGSRPGRDAVVAALCGLRGARGLRRVEVNKLLQLYDRIDDMMGWDAAQSEAEGVQPAEVSFGRM
jgi:hypothetical protein